MKDSGAMKPQVLLSNGKKIPSPPILSETFCLKLLVCVPNTILPKLPCVIRSFSSAQTKCGFRMVRFKAASMWSPCVSVHVIAFRGQRVHSPGKGKHSGELSARPISTLLNWKTKVCSSNLIKSL